MEKLTEKQQEFLNKNCHPLLKVKKEKIENREVFLRLLCAALTEERRKSWSFFSSLDINNTTFTLNGPEERKIEDIILEQKRIMINNSWKNLLSVFFVSEDILEEFAEDIPWDTLLKEQILSENFLRIFKGHINWDTVSQFQILSEKFLEEFQDKINWNLALTFQTHSFHFFLKHKEKLKRKPTYITGTGTVAIGTILNGNGIITTDRTYLLPDTIGEIAPYNDNNIDFQVRPGQIIYNNPTTNLNPVFTTTNDYVTSGYVNTNYTGTTNYTVVASTGSTNYATTSANVNNTTTYIDTNSVYLASSNLTSSIDPEINLVSYQSVDDLKEESYDISKMSTSYLEKFAKTIGLLKN